MFLFIHSYSNHSEEEKEKIILLLWEAVCGIVWNIDALVWGNLIAHLNALVYIIRVNF
jgi:hypothetical protein